MKTEERKRGEMGIDDHTGQHKQRIGEILLAKTRESIRERKRYFHDLYC